MKLEFRAQSGIPETNRNDLSHFVSRLKIVALAVIFLLGIPRVRKELKSNITALDLSNNELLEAVN
jgi:hypothetical protein